MHTREYQNRVNWMLQDPNSDSWQDSVHTLFGYLIDRIGEVAADAWWDEKFPDDTTTTWKTLSVAIATKLGELNEAAHNRIDTQMQAHPGVN